MNEAVKLHWRGWDEAAVDKLTFMIVSQKKSSGEAAAELSNIYGIEITRSAIIGQCHRKAIPMSPNTRGAGKPHYDPVTRVRPPAPKPAPKPTVVAKPSREARARRAPAPTEPPALQRACASAAPLAERSGALLAHFDLKQNHCRWPHGDPPDEFFYFCCAPVAGIGESYCPFHAFKHRSAFQ